MFFKDEVAKMGEGYPEADVTISRRKALMFSETGKVDHAGSSTVFGQVVTGIESELTDGTNLWSFFCKKSVENKFMCVTFAGELGGDLGGNLFRDAYVEIEKEL